MVATRPRLLVLHWDLFAPLWARDGPVECGVESLANKTLWFSDCQMIQTLFAACERQDIKVAVISNLVPGTRAWISSGEQLIRRTFGLHIGTEPLFVCLRMRTVECQLQSVADRASVQLNQVWLFDNNPRRIHLARERNVVTVQLRQHVSLTREWMLSAWLDVGRPRLTIPYPNQDITVEKEEIWGKEEGMEWHEEERVPSGIKDESVRALLMPWQVDTGVKIDQFRLFVETLGILPFLQGVDDPVAKEAATAAAIGKQNAAAIAFFQRFNARDRTPRRRPANHRRDASAPSLRASTMPTPPPPSGSHAKLHSSLAWLDKTVSI